MKRPIFLVAAVAVVAGCKRETSVTPVSTATNQTNAVRGVVQAIAPSVRHFDGPYELVGGTMEDRAAAQEWCSLFAPEVVFSSKPQRNSAIAFTV